MLTSPIGNGLKKRAVTFDGSKHSVRILYAMLKMQSAYPCKLLWHDLLCRQHLNGLIDDAHLRVEMDRDHPDCLYIRRYASYINDYRVPLLEKVLLKEDRPSMSVNRHRKMLDLIQQRRQSGCPSLGVACDWSLSSAAVPADSAEEAPQW